MPMSSTWNGSALRTRFSQKYGLTDATSLARILEWMNEIQEDIAVSYNWSFLKFKMKKQFAAGEQEISIAPQIPSSPTLALLAGGSLTTDTAVYCKVTFVLFGEDGQEYNSIESQPSSASNTVTPTGSDLSLTLTAIDTYDGSTSVKPTTIHRRIYLKVGDGEYYLAKTVEDNTTTTTTITANTTSTIEPPEQSMVEHMSSEKPIIEASGRYLCEVKLDDIIQYDPNLTSTGTPESYARISPDKILIYPKPSANFTLSYWVKRRPSRIFNDSSRAIQLPVSLRTVLDLGVSWKGHDYRDRDSEIQKLNTYESFKEASFSKSSNTGGQAMKVKVVC